MSDESKANGTGPATLGGAPVEAPWKRDLRLVLESAWLDLFVFGIIFIDGVFFGLSFSLDNSDDDKNSDSSSNSDLTVLFLVQGAFTAGIFAVEAFLKLMVYSVAGYFRSNWNKADFVVTVISVAAVVAEGVLSTSNNSDYTSYSSIIVLVRLSRLLRFVRVVHKVRAISVTKRFDVNLPAAKCIDILQQVKHQMEDGGKVNVEVSDLDYVIEQIRSKTLYRLRLDNKNVGDEEMQAYLESTIDGATGGAPEKERKVSEDVRSEHALAVERRHSVQPQWDARQILDDPNVDITALDAVMKTYGEWDWNVFKCRELCSNHELVFTAFHCFQFFDLPNKLGIDLTILRAFLKEIESGYRDNPYHNRTHATDVLQGTFFFLHSCGLAQHLTPHEICALIVSAVIHDYEHPGVNNVFLVNTDDDLAIRYNDKAVLEMHHVAASFLLMKKPEFNIFASFDRDDRKHMRAMMIDMVLGTEMAAHFEVVALFKSKLGDGGLNLEQAEDKKLVMKMLLHVADISNPARSEFLAGKWTENVMAEFFQQGDQERTADLKISMFMDRHTTSTPKCQIGFIDFIVKPLHETWGEFLCQEGITSPENEQISALLVGNISHNREFWQRRQAEEAPPPPAVPSA